MIVTWKVHGPLELERKNIADKKYQRETWDYVDSKHPDLSYANGVYLFSLRNGKNYKPVYVGITNSQGLRKEVFNSSNLVKIMHKLAGHKGTLCLHFLAKPNAKHKGYSKNISDKCMKWVEVFVLFVCRQKNSSMLNKSHTKFLDTVEIDGVTKNFSKGKPSDALVSFRNALGFDW